jgi:3-hydroxyacyl-[acyl-carrier-protein] dehydratase
MMRKDFFSIEQQEINANEASFLLNLLPDCPVYQGHFPEKAIAPGVCNIEMIKSCAEVVLNQPLFLSYIAQCRLTALVTPNEYPQLKLSMQLTPMEIGWKLVAKLTSVTDEVCMELKAEVTPA